MLASCTTSKCAAWDTMGSDDSEMMWSQTPDKVLHWVVGGRWEIILSREWNVPWWLRCHEVSTLTTCRILFSVSYTEQSWGEYSEKHSYLWRTRPKRVIIGISAVGGYKQKSSSLAPITLHTPTQTCTNTKQMNHQCGGTSPSLSLSLPVFCYSFFFCPNSLSLSRSRPQLLFFSLPPLIFFSHLWVLSLLNIKKKHYRPRRPF